MRNARSLALWLLTGAAGLVLLVWAYPQAFPFLPPDWGVNRREATAVALERFRALGPAVEEPYVVSRMDTDPLLERRLQLSSAEQGDRKDLTRSRLAPWVLQWQVTVYKPGALSTEWTYRAWIAPDGQVTGLRLRVPPEDAGEEIDPAQARARADAFLREQGYDLSQFQEPPVRRTELNARTDLTLRYRYREQALGESIPYGIAVNFAGRRLTGFNSWFEDPQDEVLQQSLQATSLMGNTRILLPFVLIALAAYPFLRRYHEGEVGVKRASQVFLLIFLGWALVIALGAKASTEGQVWGGLSRQQVTWAWGIQIIILLSSAMALAAFLGWAVGEVLCRERWGQKLAAFDALFQREWSNATVARSSLRGIAAGLGMTGLFVAGLVSLRPLGAAPLVSFLFGPWWESSPWPGLTLLFFCLGFTVVAEFFSRLILIPLAIRRLGLWGGGLAAAAIAGLLFWPPVTVLPTRWELAFGLIAAAIFVFLFLRYDLLTSLLAGLTSSVLWPAMPFLLAQDGFLRFQGILPLALLAAPLIVSLRYLGSDKEFVYRYEDIPPHVRRIAERERQRVELETARRIQSSILPELPPRIAGVDIAHAYLPASEVGGDFYDVLALEDGRLAVAVGDVAGHGVSSGLVMSMAKSALAVQVTFDPDVSAVFRTLNRTIYQTARKRLLATLCYAVLDPRRLELLYASAGHLYPYRITAGGKVMPLESVAYPLGVRGEINILPKEVHLAPGDTLFLLSDGVVEARAEGSEDLFGFERLEASLTRYASRSVEGLRDGVLADVAHFTGSVPREDDQTILVLRLP
ncbi:MAG TPA: PP2C family protein-serine/threonine phosphatase [Thermoanaerobaculia bacterium]|nr:PP2C family protein-serine/threonine phosphatase [Thermoanaerobaculia bacterium]